MTDDSLDGEYQGMVDRTVSDSNSEGDWEYILYVCAADNSTNYDYDEIPTYGRNRYTIQGYFSDKPNSPNYSVESESGTYYIENSENDCNITFDAHEPGESDNPPWSYDFSIGASFGPISSGLSLSEDGGPISTYSESCDYYKWKLEDTYFPESQDDSLGGYVNLEAGGEVGYQTMKAKSTYSWDYVDTSQDSSPVVFTESETASKSMYPYIQD